MKKFQVLVLSFFLLSTTAFAQRKYVGWSIGYLPNYENFPVSKVNWACYTHLAWFSINATSSGAVSGLNADTAKAFTAACHGNNTKAIICVGGAGAATHFVTATANSAIMTTFVNSMVGFMQSNGFDGIDIDWEDDGKGIPAAQYLSLFQNLSAALNKITPKPLLTVAVADYYSTVSAPVYSYVDQMNIMSYYDSASACPTEIASFTGKGVPKNKLGIGYGFDTDNEVDVNNPRDIGAKCRFSINNGCGGIMVWDIPRASVLCNDTTIYYVNKVTGIRSFHAAGEENGLTLSIKSNRITGQSEICYTVPGTGLGTVVDVSMFDIRGSLIKTLVHGPGSPGVYSVPLRQNNASVKPGVYIVKFQADSRNAAVKAFIVK